MAAVEGVVGATAFEVGAGAGPLATAGFEDEGFAGVEAFVAAPGVAPDAGFVLAAGAVATAFTSGAVAADAEVEAGFPVIAVSSRFTEFPNFPIVLVVLSIAADSVSTFDSFTTFLPRF